MRKQSAKARLRSYGTNNLVSSTSALQRKEEEGSTYIFLKILNTYQSITIHGIHLNLDLKNFLERESVRAG